MDTIVRVNGHVVETATVIKTIAYILHSKPGFYSIEEVQNMINKQVRPEERFTRDMVRTALIKILSKYRRQIS